MRPRGLGTELGSGDYDITDIAVGTNSDGRLEVFAIDNHGTGTPPVADVSKWPLE